MPLHRHLTLWLAGILLLSAGCAGQVPFASMAPAWSAGLVSAHAGRVGAQAHQIGPPALGSLPDSGLLLAWADGAAVYTRQLRANGALSVPVSIAIGSSPWDTALLPGADGEWHLLWRDFDAYDRPRLFSAHLDPDGQLLRGPLTLSPEGVSRYQAQPGDGGAVVLLWASAAPQPDLYGTIIDAQGRPSAAPPTLVSRRAEFPALARTASGTWLAAWLAWPDVPHADSSSRVITLASSEAGLPWQASTRVALDQLVFPDFTTYVESFTLGLDHTVGYIFVGLRDAASQTASTSLRTFSLATRQLGGRASPVVFPAQPLTTESPVMTGFNTGAALAFPVNLEAGIMSSHPAPVPGQHLTLPVAFAVGEGLVIGYFSEGSLAGYQPVIQSAQPLGALALAVTRGQQLILGWANAPRNASDPAPLVISGTGLAAPAP